MRVDAETATAAAEATAAEWARSFMDLAFIDRDFFLPNLLRVLPRFIFTRFIPIFVPSLLNVGCNGDDDNKRATGCGARASPPTMDIRFFLRVRRGAL